MSLCLEEEYTKVVKLRDKLDKLIPSNSANIELIERNAAIYFTEVQKHFSTVNIIKYRKLQNIEIKNLNRVNIFVGGNNLGKTSILELFYLFTRLNNFQSIIDLERFRGRFIKSFQQNGLIKFC